MAENTFGNRLGGRLSFEPQTFVSNGQGFAAPIMGDAGLKSALATETSSIESATEAARKQLQEAFDNINDEKNTQDADYDEQPWKSPIDPDGEGY